MSRKSKSAEVPSVAAPSPNEEREKKIFEEYNNWNPLMEEAEGIGNQQNPLLGTRELKASEIPCRFYNGEGETCFKKICPYSHDKLLAKARLEKRYNILAPKEVFRRVLYQELRSQQEDTAGSINTGYVISIVNPWNFVIIPVGDFSCSCDKEDGEEPREGYEYSGLKCLTEMWADLDYYATRPHDVCHSYQVGQLVAVKTSIVGDKYKVWARAVVRNTELLEDEDIPVPTVSLRLIDFGTLLSASVKDLIPLPRSYLRYPPLGYKCSLYGISPLLGRWSSKNIEMFRSMVEGKKLIFEIRKGLPPATIDEEIKLEDEETPPYQVNIYVRMDGNKNYVDIADYMVNQGMVLAWHPFPNRPYVLSGLPKEEIPSLVKLLTKTDLSHQKLHIDLPPHVQDREGGRIEKYFNRMPSNTPGSALLKPPQANRSKEPPKKRGGKRWKDSDFKL